MRMSDGMNKATTYLLCLLTWRKIETIIGVVSTVGWKLGIIIDPQIWWRLGMMDIWHYEVFGWWRLYMMKLGDSVQRSIAFDGSRYGSIVGCAPYSVFQMIFTRINFQLRLDRDTPDARGLQVLLFFFFLLLLLFLSVINTTDRGR